jgi:aspartyl-tRNA(Asn)/glutamyl-tRNA(Gln) amidotransferase subunit C
VAITRDQVRHIARLANLEFGEAEQERFTRQLSAILEHVETLNRLDTSAIAPTAHAGGDAVLLREDALRPTLDRDTALEAAPDADRGLVKVPRVLG